jgi:hypothetical protein
MDVDIRRKPWNAPRLRGRGEQGNIVIRSQSLSALYVATFAYTHNRAQPDHTSDPQSSALLTTASQARRAPRSAKRDTPSKNPNYEHHIP